MFFKGRKNLQFFYWLFPAQWRQGCIKRLQRSANGLTCISSSDASKRWSRKSCWIFIFILSHLLTCSYSSQDYKVTWAEQAENMNARYVEAEKEKVMLEKTKDCKEDTVTVLNHQTRTGWGILKARLVSSASSGNCSCHCCCVRAALAERCLSQTRALEQVISPRSRIKKPYLSLCTWVLNSSWHQPAFQTWKTAAQDVY